MIKRGRSCTVFCGSVFVLVDTTVVCLTLVVVFEIVFVKCEVEVSLMVVVTCFEVVYVGQLDFEMDPTTVRH